MVTTWTTLNSFNLFLCYSLILLFFMNLTFLIITTNIRTRIKLIFCSFGSTSSSFYLIFIKLTYLISNFYFIFTSLRAPFSSFSEWSILSLFYFNKVKFIFRFILTSFRSSFVSFLFFHLLKLWKFLTLLLLLDYGLFILGAFWSSSSFLIFI